MEITKENQRELALNWAEALESGKYKQCTGTLQKGDSYCCVGVFGKINNIELHNGLPYEEVYKCFGETSDYWWLLNDIEELTFSEIAQVIRKEYL